jgi:hypothetical protein
MAGRTGIRVRAYALMGNHYHLVLATPKANLVAGMQWFQNTYTRRFNVRHRMWGHLFGGRYKAIVVQHREGDYFRRLLDYVHLNPVRAGLIPRGAGFDQWRWTSLREYRQPPSKRAEWMDTGPGFEAAGLPDTPAGRRAFIGRLERMVDWSEPDAAGKVLWEGQSLQSTLQRGWYFGSQAFRDLLLGNFGGGSPQSAGKRERRYDRAELKDHDLAAAKRIVAAGLECMGLEPAALPGLRKNDERKALLARLLMERTSVRQQWIAETLHMGSKPYVSRLASQTGERLRKGDRRLIQLQARIVTIITEIAPLWRTVGVLVILLADFFWLCKSGCGAVLSVPW